MPKRRKTHFVIFLNPMFGDRTSCGIRLRRGFTLPVSHEPGKVTCRRCLAKVGRLIDGRQEKTC